jgi:hypothetical protein
LKFLSKGCEIDISHLLASVHPQSIGQELREKVIVKPFPKSSMLLKRMEIDGNLFLQHTRLDQLIRRFYDPRLAIPLNYPPAGNRLNTASANTISMSSWSQTYCFTDRQQRLNRHQNLMNTVLKLTRRSMINSFPRYLNVLPLNPLQRNLPRRRVIDALQVHIPLNLEIEANAHVALCVDAIPRRRLVCPHEEEGPVVVEGRAVVREQLEEAGAGRALEGYTRFCRLRNRSRYRSSQWCRRRWRVHCGFWCLPRVWCRGRQMTARGKVKISWDTSVGQWPSLLPAGGVL